MYSGRCWYSTCTTSGISLLAWSAVLSLVYSALPAPAFCQTTWMVGCDLLNSSTWSSMCGTHDQKLIWTALGLAVTVGCTVLVAAGAEVAVAAAVVGAAVAAVVAAGAVVAAAPVVAAAVAAGAVVGATVAAGAVVGAVVAAGALVAAGAAVGAAVAAGLHAASTQAATASRLSARLSLFIMFSSRQTESDCGDSGQDSQTHAAAPAARRVAARRLALPDRELKRQRPSFRQWPTRRLWPRRSRPARSRSLDR